MKEETALLPASRRGVQSRCDYTGSGIGPAEGWHWEVPWESGMGAAREGIPSPEPGIGACVHAYVHTHTHTQQPLCLKPSSDGSEEAAIGFAESIGQFRNTTDY